MRGKNFDPEEALQKISEKYEASSNSNHQEMREKLDELLFYVNMVKNSTTISLGDNEALTKLFTGQLMYVDTRDISLAPHLMMEGRWEPEITEHWREFVKPDSVVFDVGANFGYFSIIAGADLEKKGTQIHLFEPNERLCELIKKTLAVTGLFDNTQVVPKAVGDKKGTVTLSRIKNYWGSTTARTGGMNEKYEIEEKIEVPVVSLDDYCQENKVQKVDLIKIDVEGFEDKVYKGMKNLIKRNRDNLTLFLEFTFGAYEDDAKFFKEITNDFAYCYRIKDDGSLEEVETYETFKKSAEHEWTMIVASNSAL